MNIELEYADLKSLISSKNLTWQFTETPKDYFVFTYDSQQRYSVRLYKPGFEPLNCANCATDTTDFETNFKSLGNPNLLSMVNVKDAVGTKKVNVGPRSFLFSHNLCDHTTWYGDAVRVVGEAVGTGDGAQTVFNLANTNVIDLAHGKVTDEDLIVPTAAQGGSDFLIHVYLDAVEQTEIPFSGSSGDYKVNYTAGSITFVTPPGSGVAVTADYFYENGSTMYLRPLTGFKSVITTAEAMFSSNIVMTDNLVSAIYTYDPGQGAPPAKFEYPGSRIRFKRIYDFINYTNGSFPVIAPIGGVERGSLNSILQLRWDYTSAIDLPDSAGAELRIWMENHLSYSGETASIVFYGYDVSET